MTTKIKMSPNMRMYRGNEYFEEYGERVMSEVASVCKPLYAFHSDNVGIPLKDIEECPVQRYRDDYGLITDLGRQEWIRQGREIDYGQDLHSRYHFHTIRHEDPDKGWLWQAPAMNGGNLYNLQQGQIWQKSTVVNERITRSKLHNKGLWYYPVLVVAVNEEPLFPYGRGNKGCNSGEVVPQSHPSTLGFDYVYRVVERWRRWPRVFTGDYDKIHRLTGEKAIRNLGFTREEDRITYKMLFCSPDQALHHYLPWRNRKVSRKNRYYEGRHLLRTYRVILGKPRYIDEHFTTRQEPDKMEQREINYDVYMRFSMKEDKLLFEG